MDDNRRFVLSLAPTQGDDEEDMVRAMAVPANVDQEPIVGSPLRRIQSFPYSGDFASVVQNGASAATLQRRESEASLSGSQDVRGAPAEYRPLIERIRSRIDARDPFFSLEFFPPKTPNGVVNFLQRLDRFADGGPLFVDVTWHMGSDPGNAQIETSSTSIAAACLDFCRVDTMLHVTCAQYTKEQTLRHVQQAKDLGMRNLLALRGDLPQDNENVPIYKYRALDMVRWIKEEFGDYFTIGVSGYPSGHPEAPSYAADLQYLKSKCDAGADLVITQLFFEDEVFSRFVADCRSIGISVPIIPGIMPIQSYENIRRIAQLSKLTIPQFVLDKLEPIKSNDEAVRNYGVWLAADICRKLFAQGVAPSVHIYTLNREAASRDILQQLGLWQKQGLRLLPWKPHTDHPSRFKEDVRPIFWSARPKSYIYRTKDWDDFPNGRWGNSSSPAFGDLKDYYLFYLKGQKPKEDLLKMWGFELQSETDVWRVFEQYISGSENERGVKVTRLPWSEIDMSAETVLVRDQLSWCNRHGIMTINSQPNVNGAPSSDPLVGWGQPGGYCYQKAYLEFFVSRKHAEALHRLLPQFPRVSYHIINHDSSVDWTNQLGNMPIAVTWGVFPGCEIAQPTVVDPISYRVWKDEAFDAWLSQWAHLYADESDSHVLLRHIHDTYCLVTLVDNDFPLPPCLWDLLEQMLSDARKDAAASQVENVNFDV